VKPIYQGVSGRVDAVPFDFGFVGHFFQKFIQLSLKLIDHGTLIVSNAFMKTFEQFWSMAT